MGKTQITYAWEWPSKLVPEMLFPLRKELHLSWCVTGKATVTAKPPGREVKFGNIDNRSSCLLGVYSDVVNFNRQLACWKPRVFTWSGMCDVYAILNAWTMRPQIAGNCECWSSSDLSSMAETYCSVRVCYLLYKMLFCNIILAFLTLFSFLI